MVRFHFDSQFSIKQSLIFNCYSSIAGFAYHHFVVSYLAELKKMAPFFTTDEEVEVEQDYVMATTLEPPLESKRNLTSGCR